MIHQYFQEIYSLIVNSEIGFLIWKTDDCCKSVGHYISDTKNLSYLKKCSLSKLENSKDQNYNEFIII